MKNENAEKYLQIKQTAQEFKLAGILITSRTVIRMCVRGELVGAKKIGGRWFVPRSAIDVLKG